MKKILHVIAILTILLLLMFSINSYAATPLNSVTVDTDKTVVNPGTEVKVKINFGQDLGSYTFDVAYDNKLFEYVSAEGGTPNDNGTRVRVVFFDSSGGTNPRQDMTVTFKAKADITTSNPTDFSVTAEGLANNDASVTYDDITTPIKKSVTVEPKYVDYTFKLQYSGDIIKKTEKDMTLSYSSPMGRYYDHVRLVAEATTPNGASVQLLGQDESQVEHDVIKDGWGDASGDKIGGKNVSQTLKLKGIFSDAGKYTVKFKLIDLDNSNSVITEKQYQFNVLEKETSGSTNTETNKPENVTKPETNKNETTNKENNKTQTNNEKMPTKLPKTGYNIYVPVLLILFALITTFIYINRQK